MSRSGGTSAAMMVDAGCVASSLIKLFCLS